MKLSGRFGGRDGRVIGADKAGEEEELPPGIRILSIPDTAVGGSPSRRSVCRRSRFSSSSFWIL